MKSRHSRRLDVGASSDHVHANGDARIVGVPELGEKIVGLLAGCAVGDLLAKVVSPAELLTDDLGDVFGVTIVLGEDDGLRDLGPARENVHGQAIAEGANDEPDLVLGDDVSIKFLGGVGQVVVQLLVADTASLAFAVRDDDAGLGFEGRSLLADLRLNAVEVKPDVDAVSDRVVVAVLHDEVVVEETNGVFRRRCREADEEGVEVFEDLPPEVVDRAVALVGHNDVEGLDGNLGVVRNGHRFLEERRTGLEGRLLFVALIELLVTLQHRVEPLDCRNADATHRVDGVRAKMLNVELLGEAVAAVGALVLLKLGVRLLTEVLSIHKEEDSASTGELDEPVR